jgi:hypothetical protein
MKISIEFFRGASAENIDEKIIQLFQEHDEITIIELNATYGGYLESVEALKDDIASYFAENQIEDSEVSCPPLYGTISITYFAKVDIQNIEEHLKELWDSQNQITIFELGLTYTNTPESIEQLKKDIELYFSVKEDKSSKRYKIVGTGLITVLFYLQLLGIVIGILLCLGQNWLTGLWMMIGSFLNALVYSYLIDLGTISKIHEDKIIKMEARLSTLEKQGECKDKH